MGDITVTNDPLKVKVHNESELLVKGRESEPVPTRVQEVQKIAHVAAQIKEINHIDPIAIEAFHVNEVKNIDPIHIAKFNVTNLPTVNMLLRQLPLVDFSVRRLPALSVGSHQNFRLPSYYTVRARFLGIEVFRIHLEGETAIVPMERFRREQGRSDNRSFPVPEASGNAAIPSLCLEKEVTVCRPPAATPLGPSHRPRRHGAAPVGGRGRGAPLHHPPRVVSFHLGGATRSATTGSISFGPPGLNLQGAGSDESAASYDEGCVSSGD
ncbi:MAG: hypothetical protein GX443_18930 [Deltaproteobacteria bacterium]|nr:hypothetical protein [Deltaproteobacteria bacterium]